MRAALASLIVLILLMLPVAALEYEEKPDITIASISVVDEKLMKPIITNHITRGEKKIINVVVYNDARREKVSYDNSIEAKFFANENMLFTAYNVEIWLEGDDDVSVLSPKISIPAMQPMQPVTLSFVVKVKETAKTGEHELKLKARFYRIDGVRLVPLGEDIVPTTRTITISYDINIQTTQPTSSNGTLTNATSYEMKFLTKEYEIDYTEEYVEVPLKIYVEERDVKIALEDVKSDATAVGKGWIEVKVKNVGEKVARNAYLVLKLPEGFEAFGGTQKMQVAPGMLPGAGMMPSGMMAAGLPTMAMPTAMSAGGEVSYFVGTLAPGGDAVAKFVFKAKVKDGGNYTFTLKLRYVDEYGNVRESNEVPIGVTVRNAPKVTVCGIESAVHVNAKGSVKIKLKSDSNMNDVSVEIRTNPPLSALSSEYYVGDVKAGEEFEVTFTLKASDEAEPVVYPVELIVKFRSMDEYFELDPIKVGVAVKPKIEFSVEGIAAIAAGEEGIVVFRVKNTGNFTVRDATARITIVDPFSSTDDTAFLGTLKPGEAAEAKFKISVDKDATPKTYALNMEIKYRDPEGEWVYSEPIKAVIEVKPAKPPYVLFAAVVAIIAIAAIAYLKRR